MPGETPEKAGNSAWAKRGCPTNKYCYRSTSLGDQDDQGHIKAFRANPIRLMQRIRDEYGYFDYVPTGWKVRRIVVERARPNESFFRSSYDNLGQIEARCPFMTPLFGKGVVFDASPRQCKVDAAQRSAARQANEEPTVTIEDRSGG